MGAGLPEVCCQIWCGFFFQTGKNYGKLFIMQHRPSLKQKEKVFSKVKMAENAHLFELYIEMKKKSAIKIQTSILSWSSDFCNILRDFKNAHVSEFQLPTPEHQIIQQTHIFRKIFVSAIAGMNSF